MAYGVIYLLIDGTNDKEYVGQTIRSIEERFKQHMKSNYPLGRAIRAHGTENFATAIIKECESKEELNLFEKHFIKSRNTKSPNGYNLTDGGEGVVGYTFKLKNRDELISQLKDYISEHFAEHLTLEKISEQFFISKSSLSHIFKKETGLSPIQYIIQRRIGEAQSLLVETSLQIQEIEFRLGFNDSAHFSKMFKKYVGVTPKEYRKHFSERRRW